MRALSATSSARWRSTSGTPTASSRIFAERAGAIELVIHTAAQPSHDWAASDPQTDFGGERQRHAQPAGGCSRGTRPRRRSSSARRTRCTETCPNSLPLMELEHAPGAARGPPLLPRASTRRCRSTPRPTRCSASPRPPPTCSCRSTGATSTCRRSASAGGCLTGPNHAGTELHGFLSYLMRCTMTGEPYTVFGYGGKQVRDNIHAPIWWLPSRPFTARRAPAAVYNIGGGRQSNCSMLEAIELCQEIAGRELALEPRRGEQDRRSPLVDQRSGAVQAGLPRVGHHLRRAGHPSPDPRAQRRALGRRAYEAVRRHPRPQRGRVDRRDGARRSPPSCSASRFRMRSSSSTTPAATAPATVVRAIAAERSEGALSALATLAGFRPGGTRWARRVHGRRCRDRHGRPLGLPQGPRRATTGCSSRASTARSARGLFTGAESATTQDSSWLSTGS